LDLDLDVDLDLDLDLDLDVDVDFRRRDVHQIAPSSRRSCERIVKPNVPAFRASILFFVRIHALTRVAIPCRRFAPRFFAHSVEARGCQSLPEQPRRCGSA